MEGQGPGVAGGCGQSRPPETPRQGRPHPSGRPSGADPQGSKGRQEPPVAMATGQAPLKRPGRRPVRALLPERASRGLPARPLRHRGAPAPAERPAPSASPRAPRTHLQPSPPPPRGSNTRCTRASPSPSGASCRPLNGRGGASGGGASGAGPAKTKAGSSRKPPMDGPRPRGGVASRGRAEPVVG